MHIVGKGSERVAFHHSLSAPRLSKTSCSDSSSRWTSKSSNKLATSGHILASPCLSACVQMLACAPSYFSASAAWKSLPRFDCSLAWGLEMAQGFIRLQGECFIESIVASRDCISWTEFFFGFLTQCNSESWTIIPLCERDMEKCYVTNLNHITSSKNQRP